MTSATSQTYSWFNQVTNSLQPRPNLLSQLRLAGAEVPRPRHVPLISQRQQVILLPAGCKIKFSMGQLHQPAWLRERLNEHHRVGARPEWPGHG